MLTKVPRGIYFVDGKAVCVAPAIPPDGAVQKVMEIPTDHYDFFGPIEYKGLTEDEILKEAAKVMKPEFHHRYCVTLCPNCHNKLNEPNGVIILVNIGEGFHQIKTELDNEGLLIDVDSVVANGYHNDTLCSECEESLNEYEVF